MGPGLAAAEAGATEGDDKEAAKRPDSTRGGINGDGKGSRVGTAASAAHGVDVIEKLVKLGLSVELAERAWRETGKKSELAAIKWAMDHFVNTMGQVLQETAQNAASSRPATSSLPAAGGISISNIKDNKDKDKSEGQGGKPPSTPRLDLGVLSSTDNNRPFVAAHPASITARAQRSGSLTSRPGTGASLRQANLEQHTLQRPLSSSSRRPMTARRPSTGSSMVSRASTLSDAAREVSMAMTRPASNTNINTNVMQAPSPRVVRNPSREAAKHASRLASAKVQNAAQPHAVLGGGMGSNSGRPGTGQGGGGSSGVRESKTGATGASGGVSKKGVPRHLRSYNPLTMEGRTPTPHREHVVTEATLALYGSQGVWQGMRLPHTPDDLSSTVKIQRAKMKPGTVHDGLTAPILKFPMETLRQPLRDKTRDLLDREGIDPDVRRKKKNYLDSTTRWPASCYFFADAESGFPDYQGYVVRPEGTDGLLAWPPPDPRNAGQSWMVTGPKEPWLN